MRILSVNPINFFNTYSVKQEKKQPESRVSERNLMLPDYRVSFGHISSTKSYDEKKISEALEQLQKKNEPVSAKKISEMTGVPVPTIYMRMSHNPKLHKAYNTAKLNGLGQSEEILTLNEIKALQIQKEKDQIRQILQEAKEKGVKLSISQISNLTGISHSKIQARMSRENDLHQLFQDVMLSKSKKYTTEEKQQQTQAIYDILSNAKKSGFQVSAEHISQTVGINAQTVVKRINDAPALKSLWSLVGEKGTSKVEARKAFDTNALKAVMEQAIQKGERISIEEMAEQAKLSRPKVINLISENAELGELLKELKGKPFNRPQRTVPDDNTSSEDKKNDTESDSFKTKIVMGMIIDAKKKNKQVPYATIIQSTGVSIEFIESCEKEYDKKAAMDGNSDKRSLNKFDFYIPEQIQKLEKESKVIKMLLEAKRTNKRISYQTISTYTGLSKNEIDRIISNYTKRLEERKKQIDAENIATKEAFRQQEEYERPKYNRVYGTTETTNNKQEKETTDVSDNQFEIISKTLRKAKETDRHVPLSVIARNAGLEEKAAFKAIKSKPELLEIWQEVKAPEKSKPDSD